MRQEQLASLPQIERLMQEPALGPWCERLSRPLVVQVAAATVEQARGAIREGQAPPLPEDLVESIVSRCRSLYRRRLRRVVNATGIVLHTNLGRAPLAPEVWRSAEAVNTGYSNLELGLQTGKRERRGGILSDLLSLLVGCESSLLVNNCASALYLMLSALAPGKEVIVSRGEQVQIGGGFRIPEMLRLSGARLVEVGTTNITTEEDYAGALTPETAMVLLVHTSNFMIRGFTGRPSVRAIASLIPPRVVLAVDQGSGTTTEEIPGEQRVRSYLKDGAQLVCFSGDKVLGGPQAGIVVGRRDLVQAMSRHPLVRILRSGKTIRSLMEEHLVRKLNGACVGPVERITRTPVQELRRRAQSIRRRVGSRAVGLAESTFAVGGGSAPGREFPSYSLVVDPGGKPDLLLAKLREWDPPIIGTISSGKILLNMATVDPREVGIISAALKSLLGARE